MSKWSAISFRFAGDRWLTSGRWVTTLPWSLFTYGLLSHTGSLIDFGLLTLHGPLFLHGLLFHILAHFSVSGYYALMVRCVSLGCLLVLATPQVWVTNIHWFAVPAWVAHIHRLTRKVRAPLISWFATFPWFP